MAARAEDMPWVWEEVEVEVETGMGVRVACVVLLFALGGDD
jgi:hypothetical protein